MKQRSHAHWYLAKEIFLGILAVSSIGVVTYDWLGNPADSTRHVLNVIDFIIAILFLIDFVMEWVVSQNRTRFFTRNWFFLFAAIPLTDTIAETLRVIRVLRLIRVVRAGEHLDFSIRESLKPKA